MRLLVIVGLAEGRTPTELHAHLGVARSTVYRVAERFSNEGIRGLRDRRPEVPARRVTETYVQRLGELIYENPRDHGWQRTTWTRELLVANDASVSFEKDTNRVVLVDADGEVELPELPKHAVADRILDRVAAWRE